MAKVKPILPRQLPSYECRCKPRVIAAVNDLIRERWQNDAELSTFSENELIRRIQHNSVDTEGESTVDRSTIFEEKWLAPIHRAYTKAGWKVETAFRYSSEYPTTYDTIFIFRR
jgi:hypothetical protein